jgi:6-phosphogluconolactonase
MVSPRPPQTPRDGYDLVELEVTPPALPGEAAAARTADEIIDTLAADLVIHAENCIREFGDFHLALSGGPTFEQLYQRLMYDPNYRRLPWRRTHLWIVADACIPFDHRDSAFRQISETIGDHADIPSEQFHPIYAQAETAIYAQAETAAEDYEAALKDALGWRERGHDRLDYVLLTTGADGHVAGLYPGATTPETGGRLICRTGSASTGTVTMTMSLINAARFVAVLVTGAEKAPTVERVVQGDATAEELPVIGIAPLDGMLKWYLDAAACGVDQPGEDDA